MLYQLLILTAIVSSTYADLDKCSAYYTLNCSNYNNDPINCRQHWSWQVNVTTSVYINEPRKCVYFENNVCDYPNQHNVCIPPCNLYKIHGSLGEKCQSFNNETECTKHYAYGVFTNKWCYSYEGFCYEGITCY